MNKIIINKENKLITNALNVSLRDILFHDILTETELQDMYSARPELEKLKNLNFFVDQNENSSIIEFQFSVDGKPASNVIEKFNMFLVPGNNNDVGANETKIEGIVAPSITDTIVSFNIPFDKDKFIFSEYLNGMSNAKYVIYGIFNNEDEENGRKLLLAKGIIYKLDLIYNYLEEK